MNFDIICRICLKKCMHMRQISHVDVKSPGKLTVIQLLKHCASVQVEEGDGLPQQVCVKCILHMRRSVLLEQLVINSDATLRSILKSKIQQHKIDTIYLYCPAVYYAEEEITTSNVIDIATEIGQLHTNKAMVSLEDINIKNTNMGREINNTTTVIDVSSDNDKAETIEQNKLIFVSSQCMNNTENIENVGMIPEDTTSDINYAVDETCFRVALDHTYCNNDASENGKKEKRLYYCMYCTGTFDNNQMFHLHFAKEHPKAYRYTYLKNLLQTKKPVKDMSPLDPKMVKASLEKSAKDALETQNSRQETENLKSPGPKDEIFKQPFPQLKKPQKRQSKLLEDTSDTSSPEAKRVKENLKNNVEEALKSTNQEGKSSEASDPEDEIFKQPIPHLKKPKKRKVKFCNICGKTVLTLNVHMLLHTGERPHMCHECGMTFKQVSHLKVHQSTHAGIKNSVCEVCGKRFLNKTNLTSHMRWHMSPTHKCTQCPKAYRRKIELDMHIRSVHIGERPFKCQFEECKGHSGFTTKLTLTNHLKSVHKYLSVIKPDKPFRCTICPNSFSKQHYLNRHMEVHTNNESNNKTNNVDRLDCNICGKVLATREGLKSHYLRHGPSRTHECHICSRSFSDESKLNAHIRFHARPKPHKCTTCQRQFVDKSALRVHNRTHTGEKPYKCEICGNRFTVKPALQTHMNIHNGILPYECNLCEKKYPNRGWLNTHILNVHKIG